MNVAKDRSYSMGITINKHECTRAYRSGTDVQHKSARRQTLNVYQITTTTTTTTTIIIIIIIIIIIRRRRRRRRTITQ